LDKVSLLKIEEIRKRYNTLNDEYGTTETSATISGGIITVTGTQQIRFVTVDGTGASTDLDSISGGNAGEIVILQSADNARDIVCKDGASLRMGIDFTLNNVKDKATFVCISSGVFDPLSLRSSGG